MVTFEVRKPDALEMCDFYWQCYPEKIFYLRPDMVGFIMNMANVNFESKVLLVDSTRGLLSGVLVEKQVKYSMKIEFNTRFIKNQSEILDEFDHEHVRQLATINSNILIPEEKGTENAISDPLMQAMRSQHRKQFNTFIFAHDKLNPAEIYNAIEFMLQPSASFAIYSVFVEPLNKLLS